MGPIRHISSSRRQGPLPSCPIPCYALSHAFTRAAGSGSERERGSSPVVGGRGGFAQPGTASTTGKVHGRLEKERAMYHRGLRRHQESGILSVTHIGYVKKDKPQCYPSKKQPANSFFPCKPERLCMPPMGPPVPFPRDP
ncbi:hypothetical protein VTK73DRAFT_4007 [Phialemonium thermophilum]|uniref:Uncharacterized protein n=1 Tax=Phialemonium thermophilum TaxID=223376 RepID=A0ABR3VCI8_9PEZI